MTEERRSAKGSQQSVRCANKPVEETGNFVCISSMAMPSAATVWSGLCLEFVPEGGVLHLLFFKWWW